ncbi:twin arginine translocase protein A [Streptomyces sp. YIM 130001]|uniref:twin-arginine translocase TatA/TatE family subunit n=1 Tax=Streptomyces sp. YIM 130001 TaxID=2259644 RepID=UPI000E65E060|nr:twin-arginine translocase TatA/TatE family subunit [Streptomyces sp. YIM 130001]RII15662.1 twin arginine translocase protein A [Streptomyces sp. YIM 130001]
MFGLSEIALLLLVVIVVVGVKKLPGLTRSAGKATRILKSEKRAMKDADEGRAAPGAGRVIEGRVVQPPADRPSDD